VAKHEKDQVVADVGSGWKFGDEVTRVFDNMLQRSIPQYDVMRQAVYELGRRFVQKGTDVVDLGASRGEAIAPFIEEFAGRNRFAAVEVAAPMLDVLRERFKYEIENKSVRVLDTDLRKEYPAVNASVTLAVLTVQFTPIEYRHKILRKIFESTVAGGALIFVEKVIGNDAAIDDRLVDVYLNLKRNNGYSEEQIERKRLSLEGVLVPVTAKWNEEMLRSAGFVSVDCFWRWMNFAGWLALK
jgi:tRNA (cmo5U34)-methyltransferase